MADQNPAGMAGAIPRNSGILQIVHNGAVSIDRLVALYKDAAAVKGDEFAQTLVAEAVNSESTAVQSLASESTAAVLATAVSKMARS